MPFQFRKEAIEEDLNTNFPSQGQGNPPLYYQLSEVVVPTYSINAVAEGSGGNLDENLRTAWDFSTGSAEVTNTTSTVINNTGFWRVSITAYIENATAVRSGSIQIDDGLTTKTIWRINSGTSASPITSTSFQGPDFVVFLRSGDSLTATTNNTDVILQISYRQIADLNGTLVNPLGFSFA